MSEFHIISSSAPPPPDVPIDFVTDDGTAISAANIMNFNGVDSTEDNTNGILTRADPDLSNNMQVVLSNRATGTVQTVGVANPTVISFTPALLAGIIDIEVKLQAFDAANLIGASYDMDATIIADGLGGLAVTGTPIRSADGNVLFTADLINATTGGGNINVTVTGIAAHTIRWTGLLTYNFGGA